MSEFESFKVLVIDDDNLSRSLLRQILKAAGFVQVREAGDGPSGLTIARHFRPELICLDNQMPGKSGLEMLAELKTAVPQSKVLMVTASKDKDTVVACIKAGARGYILKPFDSEALVKLVEGLLGVQRTTPPPSAE